MNHINYNIRKIIQILKSFQLWYSAKQFLFPVKQRWTLHIAQTLYVLFSTCFLAQFTHLFNLSIFRMLCAGKLRFIPIFPFVPSFIVGLALSLDVKLFIRVRATICRYSRLVRRGPSTRLPPCNTFWYNDLSY